MQIVELRYRELAECDYLAIKSRAEEILGAAVDAPAAKDGGDVVIFFHKEYSVQYTEGAVPAQTVLMTLPEPARLEAYERDVQQSWRCPGAEELLSGARYVRFVNEMMAQSLPAVERLWLFHGVLRAAIEVTRPEALVFKHTQQVIRPADYLEACEEKPILRPGSLNVRFFNIENSAGDMLMDTRGLAELGLHDLQCHYRELDPQQVARVLMNTGVYIVENGPVIESGQTVPGALPDSMWYCQFEDALVEPRREVLDLDPGEPYAAGNRGR